jgi:hypothetical protein
MTTPSHSHSQSQSHSHTSSSGDTNYRHETEKEYHINHTPTRADHDDTLVDGLHDSISDKEDSVQGVKKDISSTLPVTSVSVNGTSKGGVYSDSHGYEEKPEFFTYFAGKRIRDLPWYQVPLYPLIRAFNYFFNRDYHIHILGLMLALYFIGYQPIQALQTIRYPSLGNYNLAVLYGVFGLNSWLATFYIELLGPSLVLPLCGCFMIVFPFTLFQQAAFGTYTHKLIDVRVMLLPCLLLSCLVLSCIVLYVIGSDQIVCYVVVYYILTMCPRCDLSVCVHTNTFQVRSWVLQVMVLVLELCGQQPVVS